MNALTSKITSLLSHHFENPLPLFHFLYHVEWVNFYET